MRRPPSPVWMLRCLASLSRRVKDLLQKSQGKDLSELEADDDFLVAGALLVAVGAGAGAGGAVFTTC
jgi:hypothetical protein